MIKESFISGGAIFAMFFGAGNMVFPVILGQKWGLDWLSAVIGFSVTGILVPLMGLISVVLLRGSSDQYFDCLGRRISLTLQLIIMIIEGPFGIVPRALTVGYGGIKPLFNNFSPMLYFLFCTIILWFLTCQRQKIVPIIGKILTPIKLTLLTILIGFGVHQASTLGSCQAFHPAAFSEGLFLGYQTYDLPGAIYFASIVIGYFYLNNQNKSNKELLTHGLCACCISAILLAIMYFAFGYMSANNAAVIKGLPAEDMLPYLAQLSMGPAAYYIFGGVIFVACLTTAVAALSVWSNFIDNLFKDEKLVNHQRVVFVSLIITFLVANTGFDAIVSNMGYVLNVIYPLLIALTAYNIYNSLVNRCAVH